MKRTLGLLAFFVPQMWLGRLFAQSSWDLRTPNDAIEIGIRTAGEIRYDLALNGRAEFYTILGTNIPTAD